MTKKITSLHILSGLCLLAIALVLSFSLYYKKIEANPSALHNFAGCKTATATTSVSYMTPGLGTTTVACNAPDSSNGAIETFKKLSLFTYLTASTTASQIKIQQEVSPDGSNWFAAPVSLIASTTQAIKLNYDGSITWTFASSSFNGNPVAQDNNLSTLALPLQVPASKAVRYIISNPNGAGNVGIWAQITGTSEKY